MLKKLQIILAMFLFSAVAFAADTQAIFNFRQFSPNQYDFEALYNNANKTLTLKIGLVAKDLPPVMLLEPISFTQALKAEVVFLDFPEFNHECHEVIRHNFEYNPDIPYQLMMVTLRGEGCGLNFLRSPISNTRIRFLSTPVTQGPKIDFSIIIQ
ncbi:MAG: hypothetical protein ACLGGX_03295 [Bdellovibrionia bacterium]